MKNKLVLCTTKINKISHRNNIIELMFLQLQVVDGIIIHLLSDKRRSTVCIRNTVVLWCLEGICTRDGRRVGLRVEGQDGDLVASDQQEGRHVLGDGFQPGHVERGGDQTLARHRQRPEQCVYSTREIASNIIQAVTE